MATSPNPQTTDFSRDVIGRYVCNGLDEALRSTDKTLRPDAKPFDFIVIGGGSFGAALAQHLFFNDKNHNHRILVLEGGPFVLTEHVQNLPMLGLNVPSPTSIANLRQNGQDKTARNEVWGLAWHSNVNFPGLAYCVGGRSLFWGGWSPQLLDEEMPTTGTSPNLWPASLVSDLNQTYFQEASEQIGTSSTNDFIYGPLHEALRKQLFDGITAGQVTSAIPFSQLKLHLKGIKTSQQDLFKLEAPLAVQATTRTGTFPFNKFSSVQLLMKAARTAQAESGGDDVRKRLMFVPNCHVKLLETNNGRVTGIQTSQGTIPVPATGKIIIALGTVESTRLAQLSFGGRPNSNLIGHNLMAHLRSNLTIRIPRTALPGTLPKELQASALFVKGRHTNSDGSIRHYHLQITAAGLNKVGTDSEAELFKKIPDIDTFEGFKKANDTHIVITIRGIGEMEPQNPASSVTLDPEADEFGEQRAFVSISPTVSDNALWNTMDQAADEVAQVFAGGLPYEVLTGAGAVQVPAGQVASSVQPFNQRRDTLGTTHHEAGTLWMGDDPTKSVTNADGRFHQVANAYVAGPALFPTIGSPNPMLTGIALVRRLGDHLIPAPALIQLPDGFSSLYNGSQIDNWQMVGQGAVSLVGDAIQTEPGNDLGLLWCTVPMPPDYVLKLEWLRTGQNDNSGVFLRFPDPNSKGYNNPAWVGVHFGFEVQIDELGQPDGAGIHKTGAIYSEPGQTLTQQPAKPVGQWNEYEIRVQGQTYTVSLNGQQVTTFQNPNPNRGLASTATTSSFVGLQTHTGQVIFRNVRIKAL